MSLNTLIPNIFYSDISVGLKFFVEGVGCTIVYSAPKGEQAFHILKRDGIKIYLLQNKELSEKDRPQIRIETDDIESIYKEIKDRSPKYLHPNAHEISLKPYGAKEFGLLDETGVCVIFMQW